MKKCKCMRKGNGDVHLFTKKTNENTILDNKLSVEKHDKYKKVNIKKIQQCKLSGERFNYYM